MDEHKFKVGETIRFRSATARLAAPPGRYKVVAHRPVENGEPHYRIKSDLEQHERIARESELQWVE